MKKIDFYYDLPDHLIAKKPLADRSASRLLCLDRNTARITDRQFSDWPGLIHENDLIVFNDTKVIPARLFGSKVSGGRVEVLIERILTDQCAIAHVKASKSPKPGSLITFSGGHSCEILGRMDGLYQIKFNTELDLVQLLEQIGHVPLPPYLHREDDEQDQVRYQTVFARKPGAVAAPTAGLHFDQSMLAQLKEQGVATAFVTLHVGSGTFQPVRVEELSEHKMHKEFFSVPEATVNAVYEAKSRGGRVIAVGTTVCRALESASLSGGLKSICGDTDLFITEGFSFETVDALLTNFHLPESTLLMLVAAFAGYHPVMKAYRHAIEQNYRFFSYGDAMFLS